MALAALTTSPTYCTKDGPPVTPSSVALSPIPKSPPPFAPTLLDLFHTHFPDLAVKGGNDHLLREGMNALDQGVTKWNGETDEIEVCVAGGVIAIYVPAKDVSGGACVVTPTLSQHHGELFFDVTKRPRNPEALASLKHAVAIRKALSGNVPEELLTEPLSLKSDGSFALQKCYPKGDALTNAPEDDNELLGYALNLTAQQLHIVAAFQSARFTHNDLTLENLLTTDDGSVVASDFSEGQFNNTSQADVTFTLINLHRIVTAIDSEKLTPDSRACYNSLVVYLNSFVANQTAQAHENATAVEVQLQYWAVQNRDYTVPTTFNYFLARNFPGEAYTHASVESALRALTPTEEPQELLPLPTYEQLCSAQTSPLHVATYTTTLPLARTNSSPAILRA